MTASRCVGLTAIATILAVCALSAPGVASSPWRPSSSTLASGFHDRALTPRDTSAIPANKATVVKEWDAKGSPDLYGNEVTDAVAKYRLDDAGDLYEVHSPQTELPRLGSPKG